ncbi:hypothetical protein WMF31_13945 [Sorangium sp. So ce1036]|uniref:hypothetical protein n=1 Tax=Sorangium sp. So ce1036 TaxID=3133328 RepID=UPI003F056A05
METFPESGATYPGNAALFFYGFEISLEGVSATVDGEPANLVLAPDVPATGHSLAARIEPPPGEGQAIVIEGDFCSTGPCEVTRIELTAGAADTTAPAAPAGLSFNLHDYADFKSSGGDCQTSSDLAWWLTIDGEAPALGASPVIYTIEAFRDDSFSRPVFSESAFARAASSTRAIHRTADVLDGADAPEALCFRVSAIDAAGNAASETAHACKPCYYRKDPPSAEPSFAPPVQPEWAAADLYPGGTCDPGTGTGGGGAGGGAASGGSGASGGAGGGGSGASSGGAGGGGSGASSGGAGGGAASGGAGGGAASGGAGGGDGGQVEDGGSCSVAGGAGGERPAGGAALALLACAALAGRRRR